MFLGWGWLITVIGIIIIGIILLVFSFVFFGNLKPWIQLISIIMLMMMISHLVIHFFMHIVRRLFDLTEEDEYKKINQWPPILVGFCESILYPVAFIIGKPEFIGIWLAIKVAGSWDKWKGEKRESRNQFQKFLIGNALSIIFGFLTYALIKIFIVGESALDVMKLV